MKKCSNCKVNKKDVEFFRDKRNSSGMQSWCKKCKVQSVKSSPSYLKNGGKRTKQQGRERYHKNKVNFNMSRRIRSSINGVKTRGWQKLVNYTLEELKTHLESKFTDHMDWNNYGAYWHIDHIRPIASFNITSDDCDDFKECWSLNNLQPLEAKENILKGANYCGVF